MEFNVAAGKEKKENLKVKVKHLKWVYISAVITCVCASQSGETDSQVTYIREPIQSTHLYLRGPQICISRTTKTIRHWFGFELAAIWCFRHADVPQTWNLLLQTDSEPEHEPPLNKPPVKTPPLMNHCSSVEWLLDALKHMQQNHFLCVSVLHVRLYWSSGV